MRVLVACEFSGTVREYFLEKGHDTLSCDLLPTEIPGPHYQGDVRDVLYDGWDLMIAFPPCTHLSSSGARWFSKKQEQQQDALAFVRLLLEAPINKIALENPIGVISTHITKPTQVIQPWMFGHPEKKATCLWLRNLPKLQSTIIIIPESKRTQRIHMMGETKGRAKERSITYKGIAHAMAEQWG